MATVNSAGGAQYPQYNTGYTQNPNQQQIPSNGGANVPSDGYNGSPYASGYNNGFSAVAGPAAGVSGMANGVGAMANSMGGIIGTLLDVVANILNSIVNIIVKVLKGILSLFGIGKKKDQGQEGVNGPGGPNPNMNPGTSQMNPNGQVMSPTGAAVPPPPPGTNVNQAYNIVAGDVGNVSDPNQFVQIVSVHTDKAKDYRDKAEDFAKEAEKEARQVGYLAEQIQSGGADPNVLTKMQQHKAKAMELLHQSQEYTKAVYDEVLYAQATVDIVGPKFGDIGQQAAQNVQEGWQSWVGGGTSGWGPWKKPVAGAPEVFMQSMNKVNAELGKATQIMNMLAGAR